MVYMLLGNGFEEIEAVAPLDLLRRAGVEVMTVGLKSDTVIGSHKIGIMADITIGEMDLTDIDMIILPGGLGGVASIRACQPALDAVKFCWDNGKYIAAICAGPTILADLGITDGKKTTCYPGQEQNMGNSIVHENRPVVVDDKIITGASAGCAIPFGLTLISSLKGDEMAEKIRKQIVIR